MISPQEATGTRCSKNVHIKSMQLLLNEAIYRKVIVELLPQTRKFLWIVTADIKDLHVPKGRRFAPLLEILSDLVGAGVSVRLMHAKEPGPRFREDFDKYPNLVSSDLFERIPCPRIHTKAIVIDGQQAFVGSANLTGAGLGEKGRHKRNFEAGFLTSDVPPLSSSPQPSPPLLHSASKPPRCRRWSQPAAAHRFESYRTSPTSISRWRSAMRT